MNDRKFLEKFRRKAKRNENLRNDIRFVKAIALLKGKGLLQTTLPIKAAAGLRVHVDDALWAGKNVEPRILEVLPAAILHFPKNFVGVDKLQGDFVDILKGIKNHADKGPAYNGIPFHKMKHWANVDLKDKRTKPEKQKRQLKAFRLRRETLGKLEMLVAAGKYKDQTSALEAAIAKL